MPYSRNSDLPKSVKGVLPTKAQTVWRSVFNRLEADGASEESAIRQAWGALKNQGWAKDEESGMWRMMEKRDLQIPIEKIDVDRHLVFGWANVSINKNGEQITDLHDDEIDIDDLEQAAYEFNLNFRESGVNHTGGAVGQVVESFVVTPEKLRKMGLPENSLPQGWWFGVYIDDDDVFDQVKKGELTMFSIQGTAVREAF